MSSKYFAFYLLPIIMVVFLLYFNYNLASQKSQFWFFWVLTPSPYASAILNMFGVLMVETAPWGCFNHAQDNHVSTMICAMHCRMWTLFIAKHVSLVIRLIMSWPSVSAFSKTWLPLELWQVLSCESPAVFLYFPLEEKGPWALFISSGGW